MQPSHTVMSSKGQVVIPAAIRESLGLRPGQSFQLELTPEGLLLKPVQPEIPETELDDVAGLLKRPGQKARTIAEMDDAIRLGIADNKGRSE
ncbi:AbrB/MazE/SpoVT family DNA-binding domain-containing protein [Endozoicomonas sp.]|uniref:AbrB/MazE/SpoVT family DNA-binding domain-containing protein n=1 Tax=Endozoicomonas sp. TaxID=1892382 RepID=UPI00288811F7|nr:AbrB/MazE/SpoVT family DNA-binding domain-containing protein [Endozoicomonas sp.]